MFNTTATTTYLLYKAKTRTQLWLTQPRIPRTLCIKQSRNADMGNIAATTTNRVTSRQTSSGWTADTSDFGKLLHCDMD